MQRSNKITDDSDESSLLDIQHATLQAPLSNRLILDDIHYQIKQGDFVIVLGGNGSGKSSLLKLIDKRYTPMRGAIFYRGCDIRMLNNQQYYRSVKTLTQSTVESLFSELSVYENYQLFSGLPGFTKFANRAALADYLASYNVQLASKLPQQVMHLSGGEKQALLLALTMLNPPDLLLLDEHTSALDPKSADLIMQLTNEVVKKHHITCLLTTHDLLLATRYGDRLLALKEGKVHHTAEREQKAQYTTQDLRDICY
jgi:putative tryptophan/tyrosine transport system ATP-binding protein